MVYVLRAVVEKLVSDYVHSVFATFGSPNKIKVGVWGPRCWGVCCVCVCVVAVSRAISKEGGCKVITLRPLMCVLKVTLSHGAKAWVSDPLHPNYVAGRRAVTKVFGVEPDMTREGGSIPITLKVSRWLCVVLACMVRRASRRSSFALSWVTVVACFALLTAFLLLHPPFPHHLWVYLSPRGHSLKKQLVRGYPVTVCVGKTGLELEQHVAPFAWACLYDVARAGKSVLMLPMGQGDDGAHSQNEKFNRDNYIKGIKVLLWCGYLLPPVPCLDLVCMLLCACPGAGCVPGRDCPCVVSCGPVWTHVVDPVPESGDHVDETLLARGWLLCLSHPAPCNSTLSAIV